MEKSKDSDIDKIICKAVVIGGSAGSLDVIIGILSELPPVLKFPIIIVVHRKNSSDSILTEVLSRRTIIPVKEVEDKTLVTAGTIYLAPANYHLLIEENETFSLDASEKVHYSRPSIDITFGCAAEVYTKNLVCILLSGASVDGVEGLKNVQAHKGIAVVQDPKTAAVPFMPEQAISNLKPDFILNPVEMASFINSL